MSQYKLKIVSKAQATVLERLLQVTRYRGFHVTSMTMFAGGHDEFDIQLSVVSDKSVENLKQQLLKIIDIERINVEDQAQQQITA